MNFSLHPLDVVHFLNPRLFEDLNGHFAHRLLMLAETDLTESSLPKRLAKFIVSDDLGGLFLFA